MRPGRMCCLSSSPSRPSASAPAGRSTKNLSRTASTSGRGWNGSGYISFYDGRLNPAEHPACGPVTVRVHTQLDGTPILTRWLEVTNTGEQPAALAAGCSWSGVLQMTPPWRHVSSSYRPSLRRRAFPSYCGPPTRAGLTRNGRRNCQWMRECAGWRTGTKLNLIAGVERSRHNQSSIIGGPYAPRPSAPGLGRPRRGCTIRVGSAHLQVTGAGERDLVGRGRAHWQPEGITLRALEVLKGVDAVICEEYREGSALLKALGVQNRLVTLNEHNEQSEAPQILTQLAQGLSFALISDAGTPVFADPIPLASWWEATCGVAGMYHVRRRAPRRWFCWLRLDLNRGSAGSNSPAVSLWGRPPEPRTVREVLLGMGANRACDHLRPSGAD
jgi:hypothetical protein